jgi:hypothetical protein
VQALARVEEAGGDRRVDGRPAGPRRKDDERAVATHLEEQLLARCALRDRAPVFVDPNEARQAGDPPVAGDLVTDLVSRGRSPG